MAFRPGGTLSVEFTQIPPYSLALRPRHSHPPRKLTFPTARLPPEPPPTSTPQSRSNASESKTPRSPAK